LTITNDDGSELLSMQITRQLDGPKTIVSLIQALDALPKQPKPRAQRSDAGKKRQPAAQ
jgi:hypothetical protein